MLNKLPLIVVMILSLFLAFYCVDSHKNNIHSIVNRDKKTIEPVILKQVEKVYVEVLAVEDKNKTSKIVEEIKEASSVIKESLVIDEVEIVEKTEPQEKIEVKEELLSEYSEGYKLDDLEKMIMEELQKGNKD